MSTRSKDDGIRDKVREIVCSSNPVMEDQPDCCIDAVIEFIRKEERERIARVFDAEAEHCPLGAEDPQKGQAIFNWLRYAADKVRTS